MKDIAFLICIIITALMVLLHIALLFGAPLGELVMGGKHRILPLKMRVFNILYGVLFCWFIVVYFEKTSYATIQINGIVSLVSMLFYTTFLGYAIWENMLFTQSKKEKYVMTPLSLLCFSCSVIGMVLNYTS